jgi:sulfur-oxidizing protein SoxY
MKRRGILQAAPWMGLGLLARSDPADAEPAAGDTADPQAQQQEQDLVRALLGRVATPSPRMHLRMPARFSNGYSVPLSLTVDTPMTEADHARVVHILAPKNPIILAARFHFTPQGGRAAITTRVRLAGPQNVLAVAEMSDGALLMTQTWVTVDTDGCN